MPHAPPAHVAVPFAREGQTLPQAPQFWVSFDTLRHVLLHATVPALHVNPQVPAVHVAAPLAGTPQAAPQAEQLFGSEARSVQLPAQLVWPEGHAAVQRPWLQACPLAHATPQPPQLAGSDARSVHAAPQAT
jgi:hypothetical protein